MSRTKGTLLADTRLFPGVGAGSKNVSLAAVTRGDFFGKERLVKPLVIVSGS